MSDVEKPFGLTSEDCDRLGAEPTPPPPITPEYRNFVDGLAEQMQLALKAGNRVVLLKNEDGDYKRPVTCGYNNPEVNRWGLKDLSGQATWAVQQGIELTGFGIINGPMSGHRHVLDFDQGEYLEQFAAKTKADTGFDILSLPRVRSGRITSAGYHLILRSTQSLRNTDLAYDVSGKIIAELKGDGGQTVAAGSRHKSGNVYVVEQGHVLSPPIVPFETLQVIVASLKAQSLYTPPPKPQKPPRTPRSFTETPKVGESSEEISRRYNAENDIDSTLTRYGYKPSGGDFYRHPNNGENEHSVHVRDQVAYSFSPNDPAGTGPHDSFDLFANYEHNGDKSAAIKALAQQYGVAFKPPTIDPADCIWPSEAWEWIEREIALTLKEIAASREDVRRLAVDVRRFPSRIQKAYAGLVKLNPLLAASSQILIPFTVAGAIIGKRREAENHGNTYYPNLWTVVVAPTNSNKTGTRNIVQKSLPLDLTLPDSATMEALIDRIGRSIKTKDKAEVTAARTAAIAEDEADLTGGVIVADEVTGTLKKLLGGDGRNPDRNVEDVLRLAGSGERIEQPRITGGYRIVADLCVSMIGFTQVSAWEGTFGADRYRDNGLIGRVLPCCNGLDVQGVPEVGRDEWGAFIGATSDVGIGVDDSWGTSNGRKKCAFGVEEGADPIRDAMHRVKASEAWRVLAETVGDYAEALKGKIIGHAIKMAMVCEWYEGNAADWFEACAELATAVYANYFRSTYGSAAKLSAQEMAAIAFIRQNPGCSANQLRRKFNMQARDLWPLIETLTETGIVEVVPGTRKDSKALRVIG